jgi:ankyrin repeat protein
VTDANGETPLHDAATFGRIEIVKMLLAHKADVNAVTPEKKTPLDYAIEANAENITDLLKQNGGKTGSELSIHVAAQRSDNEAIQQHLDAEVDVNSLDESGATPLDYATKLDSESTTNFLRQRGGKTSSELTLSSKQTAN